MPDKAETEAALRQRVPPFFRQLLPVSGVVLYMVGTGANIACPATLTLQLRRAGADIRLTPAHESWLASLLGLALMAGILASPWSLQRLGRKPTNQLSCLPSAAGWALLTAAASPEQLLAARWLQGFGMGLQASAAPVSIAEYSAPRHRGAFLATIAFSFATGMLAAHTLGTFLHWRSAALACGSVYVLSFVLHTLSPETPPHLASKGHFDKCREAFRWLRGRDATSEEELEVLITSQRRGSEPGPKTSRWKALARTVRRPEFYKPTLIMMFMFFLFQLSGMTVVPSYTVAIMGDVTGGALGPHAGMLLVDAVRFVTAVLSCFVVNRYPRRAVLFCGSAVCVLALFTTAFMLFLRDYGYLPERYRWTPTIPAMVYIFGKTVSILPVPWAVAGEVFPLAYRSMGGGISGMFLALMFFVVVKTAPAAFETFGVNGTFCLYGLSVFLCVFALYFLLPETKDKTLYEIECHFRNERPRHPEKDKMLEPAALEGG